MNAYGAVSGNANMTGCEIRLRPPPFVESEGIWGHNWERIQFDSSKWPQHGALKNTNPENKAQPQKLPTLR